MPVKIDTEFILLTEFSSDRLTDSFRQIMAKTMGLIFFTVWHHFSPSSAF